MYQTLTPLRRRLYGVLAFAVLAVVLAGVAASYQQVFSSAVLVTVHTDRSGLLMNPGNDVEVRGVPVGEVRQVDKTGTGAALRVALQPDRAAAIPSGATARIVPNTVFGPKSVQLMVPPGAVTDPVRAGDVLRTTDVTPEINNIFAVLQDVLTTVDPAKLNVTLGAIANTLSGRGAQLGTYLSQLESYLQRLEPSLDALQTDIRASADVLDTYADVTPELVEIAENSTVTARTITQLRGPLHSTLASLTATAATGQRFLDRTEEPLLAALDALEPTARLLAEYAPEFTCTIRGVNEARRRLISAFGGDGPRLDAEIAFVPGQNGYRYPRDLPTFVTGDGPDCYGLPFVGRNEIPSPRVRFDDGTTAVFSQGPDRARVGSPPVSFYEQLFGPFAEQFRDNLTGGRDE